MPELVSIGNPPWSREEMVGSLKEFSELYEERPIRDNGFGMLSPHLFLLWFALRKLKPKAIVESGVWKGQGTWCIEHACPEAELYCLDINLKPIQYRSKRAKYIDQDFAALEWHHLPKNETLLFFDDHQNALDRVKSASELGFKHLLFEDNYVPQHADCYSLKMAFMQAGLSFVPQDCLSVTGRLRRLLKRVMGLNVSHRTIVQANTEDASYLFRSLEIYQELPPVFKRDQTRWNTSWDDINYPTPPPLLSSVQAEYQRIYFVEASGYTWMCYAKLF